MQSSFRVLSSFFAALLPEFVELLLLLAAIELERGAARLELDIFECSLRRKAAPQSPLPKKTAQAVSFWCV